ncbi:hypothetical protein [Thiocapsa sp. N5-Cardenillas]|uniref:hypothetical protein n=1 Tax=Thiocapsa sp. N5-Cardenillas TaxID=3137397 RepID=UPI0035B1F4A0
MADTPAPITEEVEFIPPSDAFRATMKSVLSGERDTTKLKETAVQAAEQPAQPAESQPAAPVAPAETQTPEDKTPAAPAEKPTDEETPKDPLAQQKQLREELAKQTDAPVKPAEEKPAERTPDELRGVQPTDPERFRKRVNHYESLLTDATTKRTAAEQELTQLKTRLQELEQKTSALPPELEKDLTELKQFRRKQAINTLPEYREKFAKPLETSMALVDDILERAKAHQDLRKFIKETGGLVAFEGADLKLKIRKDGRELVVNPAQYIKEMQDRLEATSPSDAAVFRSELANQRRLAFERQKFVEGETAEADKFFEQARQREEQTVQERKQREANLEQALDKFRATVFAADWIKDQPVPEAGPAEVRARVIAENKTRKQLRDLFEGTTKLGAVRAAFLACQSPEEADTLASMISESTQYYPTKAKLKLAEARVAELEEELRKVRTASSVTTRPSAGVPPGTVSGSADLPKAEGESDLAYTIRRQRWMQSQQKSA